MFLGDSGVSRRQLTFACSCRGGCGVFGGYLYGMCLALSPFETELGASPGFLGSVWRPRNYVRVGWCLADGPSAPPPRWMAYPACPSVFCGRFSRAQGLQEKLSLSSACAVPLCPLCPLRLSIVLVARRFSSRGERAGRADQSQRSRALLAVTRYHSGREYKDRMVFILMYKECLYFRS